MNYVEIAEMMRMEGFNPLPLKDNKAPGLPKDHTYLYQKQTETEPFQRAKKIGIACGPVSDGFYAIDFDAHKGQDIATIFSDFMHNPMVKMMFDMGMLSAYSTAGGGYHVYFKSSEKISGNVFARWEDKQTMIEIRGHGQYVCVWPSPGYNQIEGDYNRLEPLESTSEIFTLLYTFDKSKSVKLFNKKDQIDVIRFWGQNWNANTPIGKYNLEGGDEAKTILQENGWQYSFTRNDNVEYWTRPGKTLQDGASATWGFRNNMFFVFSKNVENFNDGSGYSPFHILTKYNFNNDYREAKKFLAERYGMELYDEFWSISQDNKMYLNNYKFKQFLEANDYFKARPNNASSFDFIRKDGIFLEIVYETQIKDFILTWILQNKVSEAVFNLMSGNLKYFKRDFLSLLQTKDVKVMRDTHDTGYLFYRNCIVKVTDEIIETIAYEDAQLSIWRGQVIDRDYIECDHHKSEYRTFIWNISGQNAEKYKAFQTVIGYLLHSFKTNANNKAIIFNDEIVSENPNGRSGKGLFWNALKQMKKVQSLDGKTFDFKKSFPYQSVSTDCQILVFDDVKKNFDFESLFSVITEGITIEYKGKDSIKLDVTESPKIIITTNYTIKGDSASFNARKYEVEMSSHYSDKFTPIDDFGHQLFNDWDETEWARFDRYMIECYRIYLKMGLIEMPTVNLQYRKLLDEVSIELFTFFDGVQVNEYYYTKDLYDNFLDQYPEKRKFMTQNKVTGSFRKYGQFKGFEVKSSKSGSVTKIGMFEKTDIEFDNFNNSIEDEDPF